MGQYAEWNIDDEMHYTNNSKIDNLNYGKNPKRGLMLWATKNGVGRTEKAIRKFYNDVLLKENADTENLTKIAAFISNHHFEKFMKWVKQNYPACKKTQPCNTK
jgi:type II restriction/modification system DNA methylase subunit YeeA